MFSYAIIVFREVLEIALVMGILMAATAGLTGRKRWIWTGIGLGILGSLVVALFAGAISEAMEGMGQEVFNASILLLAAFLIGWTVIWMRRHGRELAAQAKAAGRAVIDGEKPMHTLTVVIALAVLRDGSELVMLTHGVVAAGEKVAALIGGSAIGLIGGIAIGFGIYYGLIRVAMHWIFSITSWMLILLAAGMVSQAVEYLSAAGYVPEVIASVWDTSHFIAQNSFCGQILHTLMGYCERPSAMQLICYLATVAAFWILLKAWGQAPSGKPRMAKT